MAGGGPNGPALGAIPIDAPEGKIPDLVGVKPGSLSKKALGIPRLTGPEDPIRASQKYVTSVAWVTTSGIAASKTACLSGDAGERPKTTAHFNPMSVAFMVCGIPVFKKSPVILLAEQSVVGAMNCRVVAT